MVACTIIMERQKEEITLPKAEPIINIIITTTHHTIRSP
jgi:hypothetical protein